MPENVHEGHRERMMKRARTEGLDGFEPHQVLELLLFYALPRRDTGEPAHRLIERFGTVEAVLSAPESELTEISGIGTRAAHILRSFGNCIQAYGALRFDDRYRMADRAEAMDFIRLHALSSGAPACVQICLSATGAVLLMNRLTEGSAWGERDCIKQALRDMVSVRASSSLIVLYTDRAEILPYDISTAEGYAYTLAALECELADVILMTPDTTVSLRCEGAFDPARFGPSRSILSENYSFC